MNSALLLAFLSTAAPAEVSHSTAELKSRPFHEIRRDLRVVLRRELTAKTKSDRAVAVYEITRLYTEIRCDSRFATSDTLKKYKARLWSRLTRVKSDLQKEFARRRRGRGGDQPPKSESLSESQLTELADRGLADALSVVSHANGGPARLLSQTSRAFGGRAIPDYGPELVALIHRTISPEFWDVHGGPGTIFYSRPLMVLVVRATDDVHHRIGSVVGGLRK